MSNQAFWDNNDYILKRCTAMQVGTPKEPTQETSDTAQVIPELDPITDADLAQNARDILAISNKLMREYPGGVEGFLRANPELHKRLILLGARIPIKPPERTAVTVNIAWINPEQRLSYRRELQPVDEVPSTPSNGLSSLFKKD